MKALCILSYGKNLKKRLAFRELKIDTLNADDLLIEIHAAALNPIDYKFVHGAVRLVHRPKRPFAIGFDLAGIVTAVGHAVRDFNIGDEVYSKVPWSQMGTIATHLVVNAHNVALKPKNLSFNEAAGIPLVGCTVLESFRIGEIKKGTRLLILGGSGGIGTFAIQYAKYLGAFVYTTTSTENIELVKKLGADVVVDYKKQDYRTQLKEVDIVYDTLGGTYTEGAIKVTKARGKIISIAGHYDNETLLKIEIPIILRWLNGIKGVFLMHQMRKKSIYYKHVWSYPNQKILKEVTELIEGEHIIAVNDREYLFEEAIDALCYLEQNRAKGKVIIVMKTNSE
jgi:NADPH:quinone reductase-like Zn-dependent oxidoreductase